jgi:mannosyltransferase OCH1-like enzyme
MKTLYLIFIIIIFIIIINYLITSSCENFINNINVIPLNIYQTYHTKNLPLKMKECVDTLKKQNPEFVHYLFDDDDCRKFIKDNYDEEVVNAYDSLIPGAYKADLWRYCILYKYGGIYMDIKYMCADDVKLIDLIDNEYYVKDRPFENERGVYNAVMICKKGDLKLINAINLIVNNVKQKYYGKTALFPTGPGLLGKIFTDDEYNNIPFKFIADTKNVYLNESHKIINKTNNKVLFVMYPEYRKEQELYNHKYPHYSILWYKKKIYK